MRRHDAVSDFYTAQESYRRSDDAQILRNPVMPQFHRGQQSRVRPIARVALTFTLRNFAVFEVMHDQRGACNHRRSVMSLQIASMGSAAATGFGEEHEAFRCGGEFARGVGAAAIDEDDFGNF